MIVVGVDEQSYSLAALDRAGELAKALKSPIHVVYAVHMSPNLLQAVGVAPIQIGAIEQAQIDEVWTVAAPHVERLRNDGVEIHEHSIRGYPPDVLIDFAEEYGCDLAVVGSRGRSELAAFFLGSTAHRVLHFVHCDVLVVKET